MPIPNRRNPALFSWALTVGGTAMEHFGYMEISWDIGGYGTSGICSVQFKFAVPSAEHSAAAFSGGDVVELMGAGGGQTFYVQSVSDDGEGKLNFVCFDMANFTSCAYPAEEQEVTETEDDSTSSVEKEEDKINLETVLVNIAGACGYAGCLIDGELLDMLPDMYPSALKDKTCRNILEDIASALVGYWAIYNKVYLKFYPYGKTNEDTPVSVTQHTELSYGSKLMYSGLRYTGSGEELVYGGNVIGDYSMLEINTAYGSQELCEAVGARINSYIYRGWQCDTAMLPSVVLPPGALFFVQGGQFRATHCTMTLNYQGIFAECGSTFPDASWQYKPKVYRELDSRIKANMSYGNIKITNKGIKLVYINENKDKG